jgi:type IV pilus assembly protein PilQ
MADWRVWLAATALACAGGVALAARPSEPAPVRLLGVSAEGRAILIEASEPVAYVVSRPDPLTVVVELREATSAAASNEVPRRDLIAGVSLEDGTAVDGRAVARVRVALARPAVSKVRSARNTIRLELSPAPAAQKPTARAAAASVDALLPTAPPPNAPAPPAPEAPVATELHSVRSHVAGGATVVTLSANGKLVPTSVTEGRDGARRLVFEFAGVSSKAPAQTAVSSDVVSRVRIGEAGSTPRSTRVVMEIADEATYHLERSDADKHDLAVVFERALAAGTVRVATPEATADVTPDIIPMQQALANGAALAAPPDPVGIDPMSALKAIGQVPPSRQSGPPAAAIGPQAPAQTPPAQEPATPSVPPALKPTSQTGNPALGGQVLGGEAQKKYVGTPITLDFAGADLRTVLRVFTDFGLNILIDPNVPNTPQDFLLKEIPWDQALEIVLKANQLGYEVDGTVVRIAPLKVLEDEHKQRTSLAAARATGDLRVQTFALSYAKAEALSPLLVKATLSQHGQIQVDPRTNTLVIRDVPQSLQTTADLIATLDRPEPQVEVEARIVTTSRDFARAIGIQWGLNGRMTPDIGNTTNLAFPNRGTIGGRLGGQQGAVDTRANPTDQAATVVDLGVPAPNSAIGLALGAVNGAFNLDVALSALESSGKGRVLSTPRLTTQNNVLAEIAQGVEIPIQTVSNNTVTVSFKDATLKLLVTPQITAAGTVIMQVEIHNAVPDFSREVNGIPPIDTQRAITRVQVNDGETTVIGGIFVSTEQQSSDRTPGLSRIPLLGWLFKRESQLDESRELLIFLTPRIIKG